ncbi:hypothetical protein BY458DRAFT_439615 [Sporodiniella umbellata]|nr:hypothetical protein BY458DRAFT_439615 [Sporodiniella umbellata]
MTVAYLHISLQEITQPNLGLVKKAVKTAIERHSVKLIIGIQCEEIKSKKHCLDSIWNKLQTLLGHISAQQLLEAQEANEPLFDCNIVFEDICGYSVHLEPSITLAFFSEEDSAQVNQWNKERVCAGLESLEKEKLESNEPDIRLPQIDSGIYPTNFKRVAVGGTFDHLHAGHKILLTMTALLSEDSMVVGVTDDCMLTSKEHRNLIASTDERIKQVKAYLHSIKRTIVYEVVPITDPFGPTATDPSIDALVVSLETLKGGELVNKERNTNGIPALALRVIDVISADNHCIGEEDMKVLKISSSRIREYIASKV